MWETFGRCCGCVRASHATAHLLTLARPVGPAASSRSMPASALSPPKSTSSPRTASGMGRMPPACRPSSASPPSSSRLTSRRPVWVSGMAARSMKTPIHALSGAPTLMQHPLSAKGNQAGAWHVWRLHIATCHIPFYPAICPYPGWCSRDSSSAMKWCQENTPRIKSYLYLTSSLTYTLRPSSPAAPRAMVRVVGLPPPPH